ncbi:hypothetical protein BpHYR1_011512 [Brachionus plicatilis]|uniref:Uncharacterized protein n=1 Tax=Brachionus plicatilis TaxID=10195 RepID=A0A3M7S500_BRAPC|nr:hypothetical protein BpHYR1_011512 [Brachionus plicatilis]
MHSKISFYFIIYLIVTIFITSRVWPQKSKKENKKNVLISTILKTINLGATNFVSADTFCRITVFKANLFFVSY